MKQITDLFYDVYVPQKAIIIYTCLKENGNSIYVEAYDMDKQGKPINAQPLSATECSKLAETLQASREFKTAFLQPKGILPEKVLYVNSDYGGYAVWYTPMQTVNLFFKEDLGIPNGKAVVPAMVWEADRRGLTVYALKDCNRPNEKTKLFAAPFFNIGEDDLVCMGTVDIEINKNCCLEDFMSQWESYFWNSKFSHLINSISPVHGNIVQLWKGRINTKKPFPIEMLKQNGKTLKDLIV